MNVIPHIFYPLTIGLVIFTFAFLKYPRYALASLIIAKPIIDLSRDYHMFLNINFLKIYAGLFVILGVIYIIVKRVPILTFRHINIPSSFQGEPTQTTSSPLKGEDKGGGEGKVCPELVSVSTQNSPFHRFSVSPFHFLSILWLVFLVLNVVSIFIISDAFMLIDKIKYFLSILTGFITLTLFAHLFDFEKDKKFVLSIFIIAGIFPLLLWLIPVLLGNPTFSNDELRRIIGPYHGFMHFNFYALQMIICGLTYLALSSRHCEPERSGGVAISTSSGVEPLGSSKSASSSSHCEERSDETISSASRPHNSPSSKLHSIIKSPFLRFTISPKSIIIMLMLFISIAMIYKCYSKTGWITIIAIFLLWFVLQRKFILASIFVLITVIILFVNPFAKDFQKTFDNEINYFLHNTSNKETVFRGRLKTLENILDQQRTLPVKNQLFGAKTSIDYSGSDFSMILWNNGFSGIILYAVLLSLTGYLLIRKYARKEVPIVLASILVFVIYVLSSFGTHPLLIPNFQWFMWGMVGFVLAKHEIAVGSLDQKSSCPILRLYQGLGRKGTNARQ